MWLDGAANHRDTVLVDAGGDGARVRAVAPQAQLLNLPSEVLAEDVVDQGVVHGGALCKHARQEADFGRDGAAVLENRPEAYHAVRRPAADEADADEHGNLQIETED